MPRTSSRWRIVLKPSPPEFSPPHPQRILAAIIAGGQSRRFGSDKALARLNAKPLFDHVADAVRRQAGALIVVGRDWPGLAMVPDRPAPGLGPLGGLCAALHHGLAEGYDAVLTAPCDALPVPDNLLTVLPRTGGVVRGCPLMGLWPTTLSAALDEHILRNADHSIRRWIAACGLPEFNLPDPPHNFNTLADFAAFQANQNHGYNSAS
jgi:molybdenum cofactor guanylyltransferase